MSQVQCMAFPVSGNNLDLFIKQYKLVLAKGRWWPVAGSVNACLAISTGSCRQVCTCVQDFMPLVGSLSRNLKSAPALTCADVPLRNCSLTPALTVLVDDRTTVTLLFYFDVVCVWTGEESGVHSACAMIRTHCRRHSLVALNHLLLTRLLPQQADQHMSQQSPTPLQLQHCIHEQL